MCPLVSSYDPSPPSKRQGVYYEQETEGRGRDSGLGNTYTVDLTIPYAYFFSDRSILRIEVGGSSW